MRKGKVKKLSLTELAEAQRRSKTIMGPLARMKSKGETLSLAEFSEAQSVFLILCEGRIKKGQLGGSLIILVIPSFSNTSLKFIKSPKSFLQ